MLTNMVIVDDFLDNAEGLREAALNLTYPEGQQGNFPGRNSLERIRIEGLEDAVSALVHERLVPMPPPQSHAMCRLTYAHDKGKAKVHIDPSHWSGILYLSRPEDSQGGTDFFRHIRTNTDRAIFEKEDMAAHGYDSIKAMTEDIIAKDGLDDSKWEKIMQVPMRFNRLVLLRPWLWHTAGPGFGDRPDNGRLVYLMFFQAAGT
jgi:hypothetical protein